MVQIPTGKQEALNALMAAYRAFIKFDGSQFIHEADVDSEYERLKNGVREASRTCVNLGIDSGDMLKIAQYLLKVDDHVLEMVPFIWEENIFFVRAGACNDSSDVVSIPSDFGGHYVALTCLETSPAQVAAVHKVAAENPKVIWSAYHVAEA